MAAQHKKDVGGGGVDGKSDKAIAKDMIGWGWQQRENEGLTAALMEATAPQEMGRREYVWTGKDWEWKHVPGSEFADATGDAEKIDRFEEQVLLGEGAPPTDPNLATEENMWRMRGRGQHIDIYAPHHRSAAAESARITKWNLIDRAAADY